MPPFLLSPTFWKFAGAAVLIAGIAIGVSIFIGHYHDLEAKAAQVPALQAANRGLLEQASRDESRASKAAIDLVQAQAARDQAVADQGKFHELAGQIGTTLQGLSRNANATKNPLCLPTDAERQLFNTAAARFIHPDTGAGPSGAAGTLPAGAH